MRARRDPSEPSPRARVRACVPVSPSQSQPVPLSATSRMRKRRGTEALAASLITRRRPRRPSLAYAALPLSVHCHLLYLCMYIYAVPYLWYSHTLSTAAQSEEASSDPLQLHHHQQQQPSHIHRALPYPLSVTPHAFDEFVRSNKSVPCVHRAVCTVPRRGCEHMQKAPAVICSLSRRSQRPGCDIAVSGSGWPTVLGRLVEHNLASAAGRRPLVSQRRHAPLLLLLARSRDRSRPDRPQPASQARKREQSKQSPGTGRCG